MGRSRGGLTTKIHALVDASGLPIALKLTEGQAHDGAAAADMLNSLGQGHILLGDAAYDSDALRQDLAARGAWANVKPMPNPRTKPAFSSFLYRYRNLVERFFNKLKHFGRSQRATTKARKASSHPSNWPQQEFGCALMSRWPRAWLIFSESGGFPVWREYDSRCWLDWRPASDGPSLFA
jgi:transposase